jgi:hypothetical protein
LQKVSSPPPLPPSASIRLEQNDKHTKQNSTKRGDIKEKEGRGKYLERIQKSSRLLRKASLRFFQACVLRMQLGKFGFDLTTKKKRYFFINDEHDMPVRPLQIFLCVDFCASLHSLCTFALVSTAVGINESKKSKIQTTLGAQNLQQLDHEYRY